MPREISITKVLLSRKYDVLPLHHASSAEVGRIFGSHSFTHLSYILVNFEDNHVMSVAVIGAGVVGLMTALHLARTGLKVSVVYDLLSSPFWYLEFLFLT